MYRITIAALSLILTSTAAYARPATQPTAPATPAPMPLQMAEAVPSATDTQTTAAPPLEKKVCKQLPSSYSHTTQRVCLTRDEWKQVDEQMRD